MRTYVACPWQKTYRSWLPNKTRQSGGDTIDTAPSTTEREYRSFVTKKNKASTVRHFCINLDSFWPAFAIQSPVQNFFKRDVVWYRDQRWDVTDVMNNGSEWRYSLTLCGSTETKEVSQSKLSIYQRAARWMIKVESKEFHSGWKSALKIVAIWYRLGIMRPWCGTGGWAIHPSIGLIAAPPRTPTAVVMHVCARHW